jgi:hypothetical protein
LAAERQRPEEAIANHLAALRHRSQLNPSDIDIDIDLQGLARLRSSLGGGPFERIVIRLTDREEAEAAISLLDELEAATGPTGQIQDSSN